MPAIAITGGIASGKSTFTALLLSGLPGAEVFDTDACARRLLAEDPAVAAEVRATFGPGVFGADGGGIDRAALRARVFTADGDPGPRRALEAILHPRVRARVERLARSAVAKDARRPHGGGNSAAL